MPRVTDVIGYFPPPFLVDWKVKNGPTKCKQIGDESKRVGSLVDALVQQDIRTGSYLLPNLQDKEVVNSMKSWELHKQAHPSYVQSVLVLHMQEELIDGTLTGHPDFVLQEGSTWGIDDLKTSKSIQPDYWTQVVKYTDLYRKKYQLPPPSFVGITRLDKLTGGPAEFVRIDGPGLASFLEYELSIFDHYYAIYQHGERIREVMRRLREQELLDL